MSINAYWDVNLKKRREKFIIKNIYIKKYTLFTMFSIHYITNKILQCYICKDKKYLSIVHVSNILDKQYVMKWSTLESYTSCTLYKDIFLHLDNC